MHGGQALGLASPVHEIRKTRPSIYDVLIMVGFAVAALGMPVVLLMFWLLGA